jgi:hypothetical protein
MFVGDLFTTCFVPKRPSPSYAYIKITKNIYWVMSALYMNEFSFLQFIGLYLQVIGLCIGVFYIVNFVESG